MNCGHSCEQQCHFFEITIEDPTGHDINKCMKKCGRNHECGHDCEYKCY
jgi:hypothetical protein